MSEFLLVIPEGWMQLDWQYISSNIQGMDMRGTLEMINNNAIGDMEAALKAAGVLAESDVLSAARLIDDTYFLVRLG